MRKVLGVDLSTANIGFCQLSISELYGFSIQLNRYGGHKIRRKIIKEYLKYFNPDYVVMENVRLFHQNFINIDAIKRLGGLTYLIIDFFDCKSYSIDVRSWKKLILGSAKVKKDYSIEYVKNKYDIITNNDMADSICIAEVGLRFKNRLKEIE